MPRDRDFERDWLERRAAASPGTSAATAAEFAGAVAARLERATVELGEESFRERTLRELCIEIDEEALDIAGWGVLAQQLEPPPGVSTWAVGKVRHLIDQAAQLAALASEMARTAASYLPDTDAPA